MAAPSLRLGGVFALEDGVVVTRQEEREQDDAGQRPDSFPSAAGGVFGFLGFPAAANRLVRKLTSRAPGETGGFVFLNSP